VPTVLLALWAPLDMIVSSITTWGPGIVLLSILVIFHEFGHFIVAKKLGVPVNRFSIGFGPRLFGIKYGETDYCVALLPLGGYVSMSGEEPGPDGEPVPVDHFSAQSWWKRAVIGVAGPGANLIVGYVAMVIVGLVGVTLDDYEPLVGPVVEGGVAAEAGFAVGSKVEAVNGSPVGTWREFMIAVIDSEGDVTVATRGAAGQPVRIVIPEPQRDQMLEEISPLIRPEIGRVAIGFPAYSAGLQEGDRIVAVDGQAVAYWEDLTTIIHASAGRQVTLTIDRGGGEFETELKPVAQQFDGGTIGVIGITPPRDHAYVMRPGPVAAITQAFPNTGRLIVQTGKGLWMLVARPQQAKEQVGGPLLILRMSSEQARRGTSDFLFLLGVISIAIMAFNLLPLPALDGGHILIAVLEGIRRRPLAQGFLTAYQRLGLALIGFLFVFIIFNDFWREAKRGRAVSRGDAVQTPVEKD
jgi:regulator of sigma E protease